MKPPIPRRMMSFAPGRRMRSMNASKRIRNALRDGWTHWRTKRRSYLLALFGSCVVPFGIVYSGVVATIIVTIGWIAFAIKSLTMMVTGGGLGFLIWCAAMIGMHLLVPVVAVWMHNRGVESRLAEQRRGDGDA